MLLKWWCLPLYPDWMNAENTIIWLVTFQIQNKLFASFCCKTYFYNSSTSLFHSHWPFFWFHKDREITKNLVTLAESNFLARRKLSCTRLNFGEILFAGTKQAVPGGQCRSILPARVANQNTELAAYCPLVELAI